MQETILSPWRRTLQTCATLLLLIVPFITSNGNSLLRLDAPTRTLFFMGTTLRIEEFYLFLLILLFLVLTFLFVTMVMGRVWCGWFCPQTTLGDLADFFDRLTERIPRSAALLIRHAVYLMLAFLVASNLVWYFIAPAEFIERLFNNRLGTVAGISMTGIILLVYADLACIRRAFCKSVCPYGRIQLMTMDRNTLTLERDPAAAGRCINCAACVRNCPMGIDIRNGLQVECINCARCLDACRQVMNRKGESGLIHYSFGSSEEGGGKPFNLRSALLGTVLFIITGIFAYTAFSRAEATITIQRNSGIQSRQNADGTLLNFFTAYIENRSGKDGVFQLSLENPLPPSVVLVGQVKKISVAANNNRRIDFIIKRPGVKAEKATVTILLQRDTMILGREEITLTGGSQNGP